MFTCLDWDCKVCHTLQNNNVSIMAPCVPRIPPRCSHGLLFKRIIAGQINLMNQALSRITEQRFCITTLRLASVQKQTWRWAYCLMGFWRAIPVLVQTWEANCVTSETLRMAAASTLVLLSAPRTISFMSNVSLKPCIHKILSLSRTQLLHGHLFPKTLEVGQFPNSPAQNFLSSFDSKKVEVVLLLAL